jgi:glycosyltransferase involved in cell wall biosynthesis
MTTAIIHDVFIESGGAERVLFELIEMYPTADIYIPLLTKQRALQLEKVSHGKIFTSWINDVPFIHSASLLLKPFLYWYWETLNLNDYRLVISSSHSFSSKSVITSPSTLHVSYIHTPPRYLYTEFNETQIIKKPLFKYLLAPLLSWLRQLDYVGGQRPDVLIANSQTVQRRITKYYRRDSKVIYPPIKIPTHVVKQKGEYYLCFSRLAKQKGTQLAIQACNQLGEQLLIVGTGSEETYLKSIAGPTISFLGYVADSELPPIFARAKALIYCSREEDFGMALVEAMAFGVPVIAYKSGGVQETITDKTGVVFEEYTVAALVKVLTHFKPQSFSATACRRQAQKFSASHFKSQCQKLIDTHLKQVGGV